MTSPEIVNSDVISVKNHQAMVDQLAGAIIESGQPLLDMEPKHYFAHGTYTRELFIPKGAIIAGKSHRYNCIAIIPYGHVSIVADAGDYEIKGPKTLVTGIGAKAVYAHEDTLWITVHPWSGEPDPDKVEDYVIVNPAETLQFKDGGDS